MKSVFLATFAVLMTLAAASSIAAPSALKDLWTTKLYASTYVPKYSRGFYGNGYSAVTGKEGSGEQLYVTTDIEGRLYAIDAAAGTLRWSYNAWPSLPLPLEMSRQIVGTADTVVVLRAGSGGRHTSAGGKLYCFNATSGSVLWVESFTSSAWTTGARRRKQKSKLYGHDSDDVDIIVSASELSLLDDSHVLVSGGNSFAVLDAATGAVVWVEHYGEHHGEVEQLITGGDGRLAVVFYNSSMLAHYIVYYDRIGGSMHVATVSYTPPEYAPYLMRIDNKCLMWITYSENGENTYYSRLNTTSGVFDYGSLPAQIHGFGIQGNHLYFHFNGVVSSYNLFTGSQIAASDVIPGSLSHLLGYADFAIVGVTGIGAPGNVTVYCLKADDMSLSWVKSVMSLPKNPVTYGNWAGDILAPTGSGFTLLDGNDGGKVLTNTTGTYPKLALKSIVLGDARVIFTYGDMAAAIGFGH